MTANAKAPFVWESRVRYLDTDASGRIHYARLFRHVEDAEHEFMRWIGFSYREIEKGGLRFPRVRLECHYLAPLSYDDVIGVTVVVENVGRSSFTLGFAVCQGEKMAAKGKVTIVCLDTEAQRSHALPDELRGALAERVPAFDESFWMSFTE
ncbi:MAG: acyl-CoA thioesterase [Acidobacteriales bacterium]|nr:acyl-CoA thioesterase [Terriglobales bacterium]